MFIELTDFYKKEKISINIDEIYYITEYPNNGSKIRFKTLLENKNKIIDGIRMHGGDIWTNESVDEISLKINTLNKKYNCFIKIRKRYSGD